MTILSVFADYCMSLKCFLNCFAETLRVNEVLTLNGKLYEPWQISLSTIAILFLMYFSSRFYKEIRRNGFKKTVLGFLMAQARKTGIGGGQIEKEFQKMRDSVHAGWGEEIRNEPVNRMIPEHGMNPSKVISLIKKWSSIERKNWDGTKEYQSGSVYHGDYFAQLQKEVFGYYAYANPLHPDQFEYNVKMESELVRMTASYLWGDEEVCGVVTAGGTMSIINAMKCWRDWGRNVKGITDPEIIVAKSVHAAFNKACETLGMRLTYVDCDPKTLTVDLNQMRRAINSNTIGIVGSTPNYPYGTIDPIEEMSALAVERGILLHVDCCLGSYLLPTLKRMGHDIPSFGFDLPGVCTMSIDTHKYGYSCKGSSVLLFKNEKLRRNMYFNCVDWVGGIYVTPTLPGSRSGALSACTWAVMMSLGQEGYQNVAREIMTTRDIMKKGIESIPEMRIMGDPKSSVIAFDFQPGIDINVFFVAEAMSKRGWTIKKLQNPNMLHMCVTNVHTGKADEFVTKMRESVNEVLDNPGKFKGGEAAMYAAGCSLPDSGLKMELLYNYVDAVLEGPLNL